ncbi:MAG: PRC-barrel domain-containing protein [Pyrinomonadaceae bacterium]
MDYVKDVLPINSLSGKAVLSLATGNKLGEVLDVYIDPVNGVVIRMTLSTGGGSIGELDYGEIYSFGQDAIMANIDEAIRTLGPEDFALGRNAQDLYGTKLITESGNVLGEIANIFVTLRPPPFVLYEIRASIMDKLLGRGFYIPASAGYALSDDSQRLVVPDETAVSASADITSLVNQPLIVRTFDPAPGDDNDKTWVVLEGENEDQTIVRIKNDEDETILRP